MNINEFSEIDLVISDGKITSFIDAAARAQLKSFPKHLSVNKPKLYILKEYGDYLYVGTTMQSLIWRILGYMLMVKMDTTDINGRLRKR